MRRLRGLVGVLLLTLVFLLFFPGLVYAIGNPEYVSIGDGYVFKNVSVTNDQLYFVRYDTSYDPVPDEDADDTWQMALYNSTGSLIATRPLNYYQHNIISIYLTPAEALIWGEAHQVRIMGMPSVFGNLTEGMNMRTKTLAPGDYLEQEFLAGVMITQAGVLEDDWEITLLTANDKLNSTGKTFFLAAVPGLGAMVPEVFELIVEGMDVNYTAYNQTYRTSLEANQGTRLSGAITELGGLLNVSNSWMSFWFISIVFLMGTGVMFAGVGNPGWAIIGGFSIFGIGAFLFGGSLFTLVMVLVIVVGILFGLYFILGRYA